MSKAKEKPHKAKGIKGSAKPAGAQGRGGSNLYSPSPGPTTRGKRMHRQIPDKTNSGEPGSGPPPPGGAFTFEPITAVQPYPGNPRINDQAAGKVAASISEFGWTQPIVTDEAGVILAGHTRLKAAQRLGLQEVPVHRLVGLSEAQKRAYRLADNRIHEEATWHDAMLAAELRALFEGGYDLSLTGFNKAEWDKLLGMDATLEGNTPEDQVPPTPKKPVTRPGDVWILGRHRLVCGDSTDPRVVATALGGATADLYWTDPPYNVAYAAGDHKPIANDSMSDADYEKFLAAAFIAAAQNLKDGGCFYVCHADIMASENRAALGAAGLRVAQGLVWVKGSATLSRQDYNWRHEPILYGWKPGAAHYFGRDFTETTVIDYGRANLDTMSKADLLAIAQAATERPDTIIYEDKPSRNDVPPTMKPVNLVRRLIQNSSARGERVLDSFGGSGSTLIACEQIGRTASLVELDPGYCDVIANRWQEFTGNQAERIPADAEGTP
jgi:site-specific DNA-methyltransferase (adenine-specific)